MGRMIEPNRRKLWLPLVVAASVLVVGIATSTQVVAQDATAAAPAEPQPDPSGIATGDRNNAVDAGGTAFIVAEPTDKTAPDYAEKKKAFDEFTAQMAKEPLAGKLADSVGHVRIATNFGWTLNTGYLVLFMQAGLCAADLRIGSQEERRPPDDAQLRGLRVCVSRLLRGRLRVSMGRCGDQCGANATFGGTPTLNKFLIGDGQWGFLGGKGFFLSGPAYDAGANALMLFEVVFMETAGYIIVGAICERITFGGFLLANCLWERILYPDLWLLGVGRRLALAAWQHDGTGTRLLRFRRLDRGACDRRLRRDGAGHRAWTAHRQIWKGRQTEGLPGPQHRVCRDGNVHPAVWLDGL